MDQITTPEVGKLVYVRVRDDRGRLIVKVNRINEIRGQGRATSVRFIDSRKTFYSWEIIAKLEGNIAIAEGKVSQEQLEKEFGDGASYEEQVPEKKRKEHVLVEDTED